VNIDSVIPKLTISAEKERRHVLFLVTTPIWEKLDWVLYKIDTKLSKATAGSPTNQLLPGMMKPQAK